MRTPPRLLVALVTAFSTSGELAFEDHAHNVALLAGRGIEGFLIGGSTGEGPYLEIGERRELVRCTRQTFGESIYVMGATAGQSTRAAIRHVGEIADGGADAALVLSPTSLVRGNHRAVLQFFVDVADAAEIPILLYSVPRVTGYELPVDVIAQLATHPNVFGMKDSGGRPYRMQEVGRSVGPDFLQFCGVSAAIGQSMAGIGYGAITASTNYLPEAIYELVAAANDGKHTTGLQTQITDTTRVVEAHGVAGTKAAAILAGLRGETLRRPLMALSVEAEREIAAALDRH